MEAVQCHRHRRQVRGHFPNENAQLPQRGYKALSQRETGIHPTGELLQTTDSGITGETQKTGPSTHGNGQVLRRILDLDTLETMR